MKWEGREQSENVEDRRGMGAKAGMAIGGGGLLILLIGLLFGVDPQKLANIVGQPQQQAGQEGDAPVDPREEKMADFAKTIMRDTEIVWDELFRQRGKQYRKPTLVLFRGQVMSACGGADAAVGPFYCPGDAKVYIDLSFYDQLEQQLKAPGEFARAYVLAHEVGHHVQRLLGFSDRVDEVRRSGNKLEANKASVRLELQADYLAGVWAHHAQQKFNFLERGDIETALNAATRIGDDALQRQATGRVRPDSFTHGTSAQRKRWFTEGIQTGNFDRMRVLFEIPYDEL